MFLIIRKKKINALYDSWMLQAKKRFDTADHEKTELGKRALNNGAFIHYNLAQELKSLAQSKFIFNLLFKIFRKNTNRPRSGRF